MTEPASYNDQQHWTQIGQCLTQLVQLLVAVPDDSLHHLAADSMLKKVRACVDAWDSLGDSRRAGRPHASFLIEANEEEFVARLTRLIHDCFDPDRQRMMVDGNAVKCQAFFAWLYDKSVMLRLATGRNDLTAFYNLVVRAAKATPHAPKFSMAMNTLNNYVKKWESYVTGYSDERVLLHRISQDQVNTRLSRQQLLLERNSQELVINLVRKYAVLPPAEEPTLH